ncbi:oligosaccharide flippase family protein [Chitinophagaceae bacterium LB-8]|uniref:Oligosaccharide flippase family protein n=1 Tax=Paraflavisolibacter caeni TaxID=2982496 RepID=A0A9X2XUX9_9BACT|nr:oligosaccharide flippase family protein [Paraflavisolibacter caeni]MCU7548986.1 oligosaccharide flippase family protein [Paraflavisolibacter caeni]
MRQKFIRNISFNVLQLVINQFFGLIVFYLLSKGLTKEDFGELNWCLAVLLTAFNILSFGIDQVLIKRIAEGKDATLQLSLYFLHVVITGLLFYIFLFTSFIFFPSLKQHYFLLVLGIGKLFFFFSTPYKQTANGLEQFNLLLFMSTCSNFIKGIGLIIIASLNTFTFRNVVLIFVLGDFAEMVACHFIIKNNLKANIRFGIIRIKAYTQLLKEALPQLGVVLFSSALARLDWILIGIFSSTSKLAEYSFTYKIIEVSTLPLLAIAPILVPRFTRMHLKQDMEPMNSSLSTLLRFEIIIASFIALILNLAWSPVIDPLTNGKYGEVNRYTLFILTLSMPFLYLNNFLWSLHFSKGNLRMILQIFAVTFFVNLLSNLLLIPTFQNEGAATAYFLAIFSQSLFYILKTKRTFTVPWPSIIICAFCALLSGIISKSLPMNLWFILGVALLSYSVFLLLTTQLKQNDWKMLKRAIE